MDRIGSSASSPGVTAIHGLALHWDVAQAKRKAPPHAAIGTVTFGLLVGLYGNAQSIYSNSQRLDALAPYAGSKIAL